MTSTYKKKLIEVAIPLEAINAASAREKSIRHGHPSTLHLWWARRPLAACRAVLFAQLVDDPSSHPDKFPTEEAVEAERKRLFQIIEDLVKWENSTNEAVLERARAEIRKSCDGELPPVYDPFSGGCSIPLEAQRLGLPAYGSDLNPVAVMIGKAMIEIPPKFKDQEPVHPGTKERNHYRNAAGLAEDVKYYGEWMREKAFERIGHLYPKVELPRQYGGGKAIVIAWIWARTVPSPDPAFSDVPVPIASSFLLSSKPGKESWIEPVIDKQTRTIQYRIRYGDMKSELAHAKEGTKSGRGANFRCLMSGAAITSDYIKSKGQSGEMKQALMAIVVEGKGKRIYLDPTDDQEKLALSVQPKWQPSTSLPNDARNFWTINYGLTTFGELFINRQLLALNTFSDLVHEARTQIESDAISAGIPSDMTPLREGGTGAKAYAEAVSVYLACAVDRCADAWSSIATWATGGFIRFTFARHAIAMTWDFAECNVFSASTGNFLGAIDWVFKALSELPVVNQGNIIQADARGTKLVGEAILSTDPPYYDNIGYADLSDFFYVWMKRSIGAFYPKIFSTITVPKSDELVALPHRHHSRREAENYFVSGMTATFTNIVEQINETIPATIYYAFKQNEVSQEGLASPGWATFLEAVIQSGFSVVGTWPVRTERSGRTISVGTNALATSVVLVCRKRPGNANVISRSEFLKFLKKELAPAVFDLQTASIAPADLPQSAIGPGMGVFSRYKAVLEADDSPMTVKTALQLINRELDEFLNDIQGEFDSETRFAITWFKQNGFAKGDFGIANSIAQARGISVASVESASIVENPPGKVRILKRDELLGDWEPSTDTDPKIWKCCQYLVRALENEGERAAALLIKKLGNDKAEAVKDLAYCLYDICSNKRKDAKEATAYNALIAVWTDLTGMAATIDVRGDGQTSLDL